MALDAPAGFFGKLPARGDFLRVGLPRSFTDPLDDWLQGALAASRARFDDRWGAVWEAAPAWCFALPAGTLGPSSAIGVILPSRDRVGRRFPLVFARLAPLSDPEAASFLSAAAHAGRQAVDNALAPEAVQAMLRLRPEAPSLPATAEDSRILWWAEAAGRRLTVPVFPSHALFAAMLEAAPELS